MEAESTPTTLSSKQLYSRLLRYVKPYWKIFTVSIIATVLLAATEPLLPALLKPLLDGSFVEKDPQNIRLMPILLILIFVIRGIAGLISTVTINWVATRAVMDIRRDMYDKLIALPNQYFDHNTTGNIISRITYNVNQVSSAATNALIIAVRDSLAIIFLLAWMFYLDWKLSLIFFIIVPIAGLTIKLVSLRLRKLSKSVQDSMGDMTHIIEETTQGNRVIKIFGGQDYEKGRFQKVVNDVRRFTLKFTVTSAVNVPFIELLAASALAFMIFIASLKAAEGNITVGGFVSLFTAMAMLFGPAKRLTKVNANIQMALAASESIFALIDETPERKTGTHHLKSAKGVLEFRDVTYRYAETNEPALEDINLDIKAGETIALIGQSGSGKTTLANMVPRFYIPDSGQILLDGMDINDIELGDLRDNIALVSQDVVLFDDSIANNIAYGVMQKKFSEKDIIDAAKAAHAMEFIEQMPAGLQSQVGEKGARLSGGQRQRIAIARAILKNAPILILDEATSALDTESERHVQQAIENLKQNRTTIIIAHRLSTIKHADRIIVMQKGKIVESGTHDSLLETGGIYKNLQQLQFN
jgi:subfamily B ATP-binding cassette protein MsbA